MSASLHKFTYEDTPAHTNAKTPAKRPSYTSSLLHTTYVLYFHEITFVTTLKKLPWPYHILIHHVRLAHHF